MVAASYPDDPQMRLEQLAVPKVVMQAARQAAARREEEVRSGGGGVSWAEGRWRSCCADVVCSSNGGGTAMMHTTPARGRAGCPDSVHLQCLMQYVLTAYTFNASCMMS